MKKNKADNNGLVYSTEPNFRFQEEPGELVETLPPAQQRLQLKLDTKQRGGKVVSLINNFIGTAADLEEFGKKIKNFCGTGGSVKDGQVLIQGDQRQKILQWLQKNGYGIK